MIKYALIATLLKLFSTCPQMKSLYRNICNIIGSRQRFRMGLPKYNIERGQVILELVKKYNAIHNGDRLLELGTGWLHCESTFLRLFYDVNITLFDIWDNRQLKPFKRYFAELNKVIDSEIVMAPTQRQHVHDLISTISSINSFDDLYHLLGFQYVIEPSGTLRKFQEESYNAIYSCDVLEHISEDILSEYILDFYRLLKPGGYSIHTIDIGDHISYYGRNVSRKNYLRYSDKSWKRFFENEVQYFNRIQRSRWLSLFQQAGLELVDEESQYCDIGITIDKKYRNYNRKDLECTVLRVIHRKPEIV